MKPLQVAEQNKPYYSADYTKGFNDGAKAQYEADKKDAERRGRWIPITERLPEDEGQYLISCDTDYGVEVGRFYIDEDGERYFSCDWNDPEDIEAWMPLPEPYKGGEEK